ncbi:hypothetical protein F5Y04DRAFT_289697 [Hypomontagnella monticulosa]|nr:hypothetical protein F5Y04DRAFT_289697 [Hypomontagnella monticulosa]
MCTSAAWRYCCKNCAVVVYVDRHVSWHTCRGARAVGKRGVCRTGVVTDFYDKDAEELCVMCELQDEILALGAETCDEAQSETRVGYGPFSSDEESGELSEGREGNVDDTEEEDGGASLVGEEEDDDDDDDKTVVNVGDKAVVHSLGHALDVLLTRMGFEKGAKQIDVTVVPRSVIR